jgi:hypothetical protein
MLDASRQSHSAQEETLGGMSSSREVWFLGVAPWCAWRTPGRGESERWHLRFCEIRSGVRSISAIGTRQCSGGTSFEHSEWRL